MSWPFLSHECPRCRYYRAYDEPRRDDTAFRYELVGDCLHPRIGMELFIRQLADESERGHCPCFLPRSRADR